MVAALELGKVGLSRLTARATVKRRLRALESYLAAGLPAEMDAALRFLITKHPDDVSTQVAERIEPRRTQIAESYGDGISVWYSPRPGSAGESVVAGLRPEPGQIMEFSASRVAVTGKDRRWGTALYLIARGYECTTGIELGTCAGISAMYVASAPSMARYLTVEGSSELCEIAQESLAGHPGVTVINALFDEALDRELPALQGRLDFAFIDGHHERVATIHYTDRIVPGLTDGGVVVFDDISWSADMRRAWDELRARSCWSHAMDLGAIGVCISRAEHETDGPPRQWDLQPLVGRTRIGEPWGWRS